MLLIGALASAGCKKKSPPAPPQPATTVPTVVVEGTAEPLPGGAPDGAIGVAGPARFVAAASDGGWVMLCQGEPEELRVVVGDGPGLAVDRAVAAADHDLAVIDGEALLHVDVVARTARRLGAAAPATIDGESRRLVQVDGGRVIVRDPGVAPRTIDTGTAIAAAWAHGKRWLEVAPGVPSRELAQGSCGWVRDETYNHPVDGRTTVDLDPSGLEAADRIGPELGITATGEVTLDGVRVVGADCVGSVIAALAAPPRALVMCTDNRNHVVGAGGFDRVVGGTIGGAREQAVIADQLVLGRRMVCVSGACIDLVTGRDFATYQTPAVSFDDHALVRKGAGALLIDDLDQERQREVVLPRLTQTVTIDTATGRRRAGAAPPPPAFVDAAGHFLLYGRHVVDVEAATLVGTLAVDALAIDRSGRVLIPAADGHGPLRWRKP